MTFTDAEADRKLVRKTRVAVRDAVISSHEHRIRQRRSLGLALLGFVALLVLLGPPLWNSLEDLLAGEHIFDLSTLLALFILTLLPAMLAALIAAWKGQRGLEQDRGGFESFRPIDK